MPAITELLRSEIDRLKAELADLVRRRSAVVAPLDVRIADVEQRLRAAERMLATYTGEELDRRIHRAGGEPRPDMDRQEAPLHLTWTDVETVDIPYSLKGHPLRADSKRAKIIRATKALLHERGVASRLEIVRLMQELKIMGHEKNPAAYLSVILSYANEIFATNGAVWYLRGAGDAPRLGPIKRRPRRRRRKTR
jgi:hypothetical protein